MSIHDPAQPFNAEEADNLEDIEKQFAVKAVQQMTVSSAPSTIIAIVLTIPIDILVDSRKDAWLEAEIDED